MNFWRSLNEGKHSTFNLKDAPLALWTPGKGLFRKENMALCCRANNLTKCEVIGAAQNTEFCLTENAKRPAIIGFFLRAESIPQFEVFS